MLEDQPEWETVRVTDNSIIERLKVAGGHLYHVSNQIGKTTTMAFVPEIDLTRYEAHLRDAFKAGYTQGSLDQRNCENAPDSSAAQE